MTLTIELDLETIKMS